LRCEGVLVQTQLAETLVVAHQLGRRIGQERDAALQGGSARSGAVWYSTISGSTPRLRRISSAPRDFEQPEL
jgi:hypothetical protein